MKGVQITDYLRPEGILLNARVQDKAEAIHKLVELMQNYGNLSDPQAYEADVLRREAQGTTGVGGGIAIPHGKSPAVKTPGVAAMTVPDGLDYDALDGAPVRLLFLIAVPDTASDLHIQVLAHLAQLLMDPGLCTELLEAESPQAFLDCILSREGGEEKSQPPKDEFRFPRVLAVTACPTGVAHTYMAAEALRNKAQEMGIPIKVETHGADGVQNAFTGEEIKNADCILVAVDRAVDTGRFVGKPLIHVAVSEALRRPEELLRQAVSGEVPVYNPSAPSADLPFEKTPGSVPVTADRDWKTILHKMYNHLMSGVSCMLPFVTAGGILIALSYWFDRANAGANTFGTVTALSRSLKTLGSATFSMMFPVLAAGIAFSLAGMAALLPGFMAGYVASIGMCNRPEDVWVSAGIWGAILGGFIAGAIILALKRLCSRLPSAFDQTKPVLLYPFFGLLITGFVMVIFVNPPLGRFNAWTYQVLGSMKGGSLVLLGAVLGALMAVDFGGPINKAAYLFGTVALAGGEEGVMAAVMIGGMTPSIGVAMACNFFPNRFTRSERQNTLTNYILGLSFVTEGALPYAIKDPFRIIPACMAGSALAGALTILWGCEIPAPHGGIYLLPLATNPGGYFLAMVLGSALTAFLIGLFRSPLSKKEENQ